MNIHECDILREILGEGFSNQRFLSKATGLSLGAVNGALRTLFEHGYVSDKGDATEKAKAEAKSKSPKNAIILAAGFGTRMVPINLSTPKALLEIRGETMIERQIRQLHEVGITDITIVVGYMKERFEYLIDEYGVDLVVNPDYVLKNNLVSLNLVSDRISNTYIIPSDIWCPSNPFRRIELYSWYMVKDGTDEDSEVCVNRKRELVCTQKGSAGSPMVGIAYMAEPDSGNLRERLKSMVFQGGHEESFWEDAILSNGKMAVPARIVKDSEAIEINTYEQLRELDGESNHLKSDVLDLIARVFGTSQNSIRDISVLKKGMTNRSFLFSVDGAKYIMRIPGEGTEQLINRVQEAEVYRTIHGKGLCDDPIYLNPSNGYKITKFLDGVRVCDCHNDDDLIACMAKLRSFHGMRLKVDHSFDIFSQIEIYERLRGNVPSAYKDYCKTKANVLSLKRFIESQPKDWCLTHIDAVPDNFLFHRDGEGKQALQLTDWEYAGMQDPHVDIAMFCIYSLYGKADIDRLIDFYFEGRCDRQTRAKIYCYISTCGLLWSNWCEYKSSLGVEFGEYSLRQYRYAKDFFRLAVEEMGK